MLRAAHSAKKSASNAGCARVARGRGRLHSREAWLVGFGWGARLARGGWLVEERECRAAQKQAHRRQALLLAACAAGVGMRAEQVCAAAVAGLASWAWFGARTREGGAPAWREERLFVRRDVREPAPAQHLEHLARGRRRAGARVEEEGGERGGGRHVRALRQHGDLGALRAEEHLARGGGPEAQQRAQQRRLARAVWPCARRLQVSGARGAGRGGRTRSGVWGQKPTPRAMERRAEP